MRKEIASKLIQSILTHFDPFYLLKGTSYYFYFLSLGKYKHVALDAAVTKIHKKIKIGRPSLEIVMTNYGLSFETK